MISLYYNSSAVALPLADRSQNPWQYSLQNQQLYFCLYQQQAKFLDEAGLASTEQIHGLLTLSKELKFHLMMLGDVKQLGGVETGKPFHYLQEHGFNTVSMSTIKRQQNKELLKSVVLAESAVDAEMKN